MSKTKNRPDCYGTVFLSGNLSGSFHTASTGLNAIAMAISSPLEVGRQALNGSAHTVRSLDSSGIGFTANSAHAWHTSNSG